MKQQDSHRSKNLHQTFRKTFSLWRILQGTPARHRTIQSSSNWTSKEAMKTVAQKRSPTKEHEGTASFFFSKEIQRVQHMFRPLVHGFLPFTKTITLRCALQRCRAVPFKCAAWISAIHHNYHASLCPSKVPEPRYPSLNLIILDSGDHRQEPQAKTF